MDEIRITMVPKRTISTIIKGKHNVNQRKKGTKFIMVSAISKSYSTAYTESEENKKGQMKKLEDHSKFNY